MNTDFIHKPGDTYVVTGFLAHSTKKFRKGPYSIPEHALGINLWNGRVWQIRNGKRKLVKRVVN
jgi:hypothetical protein